MNATSFIPYGHQSINEEDIAAVAAALRNFEITRGPQVEAFEKAIAEYVGAAFAVAFSSGSTALAAAYWSGDVGPRDRVITSPNSFIASTGYASQQGSSIAFVDIERTTGNLSLENLEPNLIFRSLQGKLFVVPVHFAGIAVDMQKLHSMIRAANVVVIEDAAHALGSAYPSGERVGCCAYSDMTIFSFHPLKNITTGEGGMVTTNDEELYKKLKRYRNSGIVREPPLLQGEAAPWYYEVPTITGNFHLTEMQAALGISQLKRLDTFVSKRRELVKRYRQQLNGVRHIALFSAESDARTAYHLLVAQIDFKALKTTRTQVMEKLKAEGIGSQLHYVPLYRHPCYRKQMGEIEEYFPEMEAYYRQALSLPLYCDLKLEDVDRICSLIKALTK